MPRIEICDAASTDAIVATTPVSERPASRMQIGTIASWSMPDSPAEGHGGWGCGGWGRRHGRGYHLSA